jgi:hypothetical protein
MRRLWLQFGLLLLLTGSTFALGAGFEADGIASPTAPVKPVTSRSSLRTSASASQSSTLPTGTPLTVRLTDHAAMHIGQVLRAELLYPVYNGTIEVLPPGTVCVGTVVGLEADVRRRWRARLSADLTPFHRAEVRFEALLLPDGTRVPFASAVTSAQAQLYRLVAPAPKLGLVARGKKMIDHAGRIQFAPIIGPNKFDKLVQYMWWQLPYHPERMETTTAWTVELAQPLMLPEVAIAPKRSPALRPLPVDPQARPEHWMIQASLIESLDSQTARLGQTIHARVTVPVRNADDSIAIPQGALLVGHVTKAEGAAMFDRSGQLRFSFDRVVMPSGEQAGYMLQSALYHETALTAEGTGRVVLESHGVPVNGGLESVQLSPVSAKPMESNARHEFSGLSSGSDGLGFVGHFVNSFAKTHLAAISLGNYGTALMLFDKLVSPGRTIRYPHNTRIYLETEELPSVHGPVFSSSAVDTTGGPAGVQAEDISSFETASDELPAPTSLELPATLVLPAVQ